jgi:hypothetical protein
VSAERPSAGIPLYAAAVLAVGLLGLPLQASLGPMFFADPAAAIVGRASAAGPSVRIFGLQVLGGPCAGKTAAGSCAFVCVALAWLVHCGDGRLRRGRWGHFHPPCLFYTDNHL